MEITLERLQGLAEQLPLLDFSPSCEDTDWLNDQTVQAYLDHYQINFKKETLCQSHKFGKFTAAGFENACHIWQPENAKGTVFLIHGFTDNVGLYQHPIRFFLTQGYSVVAFDLPGHGLSSGVQASIDSFDQYREVLQSCLDHCQQVLPRPWHGVGQSTGGAVWLNYLINPHRANDIDKILLLAPLVRPRGWGVSKALFPFVKAFIKQLPRKFGENSHDASFLKFIKNADPLQARITPLRWAAAMQEWINTFTLTLIRPQAIPLTIIQGDRDGTVDFKFNVKMIKKKFPNTQIKMVANARHHLVNESLPYRQKIFSFAEQWLTSSN